jgi:NADH-quinone oxidoreductase subunit H
VTWIDWGVLIGKTVIVFAGLLVTVLLVIWMERKVIADLQTRTGPMRAGPRGVLLSLADGIKLFFKEAIHPTNADRWVYRVAPALAVIPGFLAFAVVPFGPSVFIFGRTVGLQLADISVGILWVLAMTSIGVYTVVLAGWSSGSNYPLLGGVRSSAQMVSYEVAMGLSLVALIMFAGHLRMSEIVDAQDKVWYAIPQFPAFVVFMICALAEVNRPPFDLAEAESELVAGYHTEYSGISFAMFTLGEYVNTVVAASVIVTLFLGGWRGPWPWEGAWFVVGGLVWFFVKLIAVLYVWMLVRATLPRLRYDRLMNFGWKYLIPFGLFWVLATGAIVVLPDAYGRRKGAFLAVGLIVAAWLIGSFMKPLLEAERPEERPEERPKERRREREEAAT